MSGEQILYNRPTFPGQLNMAHPLTKGLVGCWLLNENGGMRAWDSSPYGNHGILTGFAQPPKRGFNGLQFDGVDDYIDCGAGSSLNLTTGTLEAWVKATGGAATYRGIISKGTSGSDALNNYELWLNNSNNFIGYIGNGVSAINIAWATTGATLNIWHQVVFSWDGAFLHLHVNGQQVTTDISQSITPVGVAQNLQIGTVATNRFSGLIGKVSIYNRALSAQEIKNLYEEPYQMFLK